MVWLKDICAWTDELSNWSSKYLFRLHRLYW